MSDLENNSEKERNAQTHTNNSVCAFVSILLTYICDRLWEKGAFGAENKNVVFNLF